MCKCEANFFYASESWFLKGSIENGVLYLKSSGGGDGIEKIECSECGKGLEKDIKIEFL